MAGVSAKQSKAALRAHMGRVLEALTPAEVAQQSAVVVEKVLRHPRYLSARSVSVYLSFEQEIATDALVADIFARGKHCFIPRFVRGCPDMDMVRLDSLEDFKSLPTNAWNIRQPGDNETRESVFSHGQLDLVLAPGLAFTADGVRLGRGKGYYDAFLTRCRRNLPSPPFVLALAFREQLLPELPSAEHDVAVDGVVVAD